MKGIALLAAGLIALGTGCYPDPGRVVMEVFDEAPAQLPPAVRPWLHDVLPDVAYEAKVTCPVTLVVTNTGTETFDYLVTYGPVQMPLGVPTALEPGDTASVGLADAVGERAFLLLDGGIAAYSDVTDC